jgi:hypothetical protein
MKPGQCIGSIQLRAQFGISALADVHPGDLLMDIRFLIRLDFRTTNRTSAVKENSQLVIETRTLLDFVHGSIVLLYRLGRPQRPKTLTS